MTAAASRPSGDGAGGVHDRRVVSSATGAPSLGADVKRPTDVASAVGLEDQMVTELRRNVTTPPPTPGETGLLLDHLRSHVTRVTPIRAQEILETLNWFRQRDISESWVDTLTMAILKGELTFLTLAFGEMPNGTKHLVDGQHRLRALVRADRSLTATITTFRVMNDEELGKLYLTFDRARSRGPEVGLKALGVFEHTDTPPHFVRRMGGSVAILKSGFSRSFRQDKSVIDRSLAVQEWLPEIGSYHGVLEGAPSADRKLFYRSPVGAVALATFRHQPGGAEEFWTRTVSQEMLGADDPRRRLMNWLRDNTTSRVSSDILYARYVAAAWNAFFEGRTLKIIKISDPSGSMNLLGTPYREGAR